MQTSQLSDIVSLFKNCGFKNTKLLNWKLGKTAINLFILSFNWGGIAIPLYWIFLDNKGGNSDSNKNSIKPIKEKFIKNVNYKTKSIFRYGFLVRQCKHSATTH